MKIRLLFLSVLLASSSTTTTNAVVTDGNANDAKWMVKPNEVPFFVGLFANGDCAGTIVSLHHVVTAAHCLCDVDRAPATLLSNGEKVYPWGAFGNPSCRFSCSDDGPNRCDVAVLAFEEAIVDAGSTVPLSLYEWDDEVDKTITIYGYGLSGNSAELTSARKCRKANEDGKFRRAENVVTKADGVLQYFMDKDSGLDLEGMAQDGDSGGPATIEREGQVYLAGANSGTWERNSCDYGSVDEFSRL